MAAEHELLAAADPAMAALIERIGPLDISHRTASRPDDPFVSLARIIVGQQVSTAAARTIWNRLCEQLGTSAPEPDLVLGAGEAQLRAAGLSGRKASYVLGLAELIAGGEFDPEALASLDDDEVIEELTAVRGLGRWSAEMYLMFDLERPDVFSGGDLGLRNGIRICLDLPEPPGPAEATELAERWRPHRTLASIYLWEAVGAAPA